MKRDLSKLAKARAPRLYTKLRRRESQADAARMALIDRARPQCRPWYPDEKSTDLTITEVVNEIERRREVAEELQLGPDYEHALLDLLAWLRAGELPF
jgi:hypothetical protein